MTPARSYRCRYFALDGWAVDHFGAAPPCPDALPAPEVTELPSGEGTVRWLLHGGADFAAFADTMPAGQP